MNNMKNTFKNFRKNIVEYIITNRLFISYVILSLIAMICLRKFTIDSAFKFKPLITAFKIYSFNWKFWLT